VDSRLAGPTRLAFKVPVGEKFPYTLEGILEALPRLPLNVNPVAGFDPASTGCLPIDLLLRLLRVPPPPHIELPDDTHTAIEAPYRLLLSPDAFARWAHAHEPVTHDDWTELWHTRLDSHRAAGPRVRAVWSPDFLPDRLQAHFNITTPQANDDPFRSSLDSRDRNEIVHLTSNHYIRNFIPSPVETERLMLSGLGAWLRVQGDWEPPLDRPGPFTVEQWRHDATMGRDQYVRVVYKGYLFPFGQRASLVKVTERKFWPQEGTDKPGFVAHLFQRMFIIVRERDRSYSHRQVPFRTVRIRTRVTPNLANPTSDTFGPNTQEAFWPRVTTPDGSVEPFQFDLLATDWEGRSIEFTTPLIFVDGTQDETDIGSVLDGHNAAPIDRRKRPVNGQTVSFAPSKEPNDTALEATSITFGGEKRETERPHFRPTMVAAEVDLPAVKHISGKSAPSVIEWEPTYLTASGSAIGNAGQLFARVTNASALAFGSTERSGGLVAPDLTVTGLSRTLGPVGGPAAQMVSGDFKPQQVFSGVKLLGAISLGDIVKDMIFYNAANTAQKVPRLVTVRDGDVMRTRYDWQLSYDELVDTGLFLPSAQSLFSLTANAAAPLDGSEPQFSVAGELTDFTVRLLPPPAGWSEPGPAPEELVHIAFQSIRFKAEPGKKVDVAVVLKDIKFVGILEFVNTLRDFIPLDGFKDPPNLNLVKAPDPGAEVGYTQGIPTIGLGMMTLQNVSLGASLFLPFGDGRLNFHFAFCERQQPFTLTVSLFGGGGFFSMDVGIHDVVMIEAGLEFGASAAINLGVAKGKVSMMGGFYFQVAGDGFALTGYFRASGSLSVLGIISVSLVFYLGLSYATKGLPHGGTLWGQASLKVKIKITFFSKTVKVSMEREFAGSDPTFRQLVSHNAWEKYCDAFAAVA
jgi:hypothetical protein